MSLIPLAPSPVPSQDIVVIDDRHYQQCSASPLPVDKNEKWRQYLRHRLMRSLSTPTPSSPVEEAQSPDPPSSRPTSSRVKKTANNKSDPRTTAHLEQAIKPLIFCDLVDIIKKTKSWTGIRVLDVGSGAGFWRRDLLLNWPCEAPIRVPEIHSVDVFTSVMRPTSVTLTPQTCRDFATEFSHDEEDPLWSTADPARKHTWDFGTLGLLDCPTLFRLDSGRITFQQRFHLINVQCVAELVRTNLWWYLFHQIAFLLVPGGGLQFSEFDWAGLSVDGPGDGRSDAVKRWCRWYIEAQKLLYPDQEPHYQPYYVPWEKRRPPKPTPNSIPGERLSPSLEERLKKVEGLGFENCSSEKLRVAIGDWKRQSDTPKEKHLAIQSLAVVKSSMETLISPRAREVLDISNKQLLDTVAEAMEDIAKKRYHVGVFIITARRKME